MNKRAVIVVLAILFLLLGLVPTQTVLAHAFPAGFAPAPNTILKSAPSELRLRFTESVVATATRVTLRAQTGKIVYEGPVPPVDAENLELAILIPSVRRGIYLVDWQVLSAIDGHTTRGSFSFGVGVESMTGSIAEGEQISLFRVVARWFTLTGLVLMIGLFAFRLFVWKAISTSTVAAAVFAELDLIQARRGLQISITGLLLFAIGLLLNFIENTLAYGLFAGGGLQEWLESAFGSQWVLRLFLTISIGFLLLSLRAGLNEQQQVSHGWEWWAGFAVAIGLTWTNAQTSHSAAVSQDQQWAIAVDVAHVIGAGLWIGSLIYLLVSLRQIRQQSPPLRSALALQLALNFSPLGALAVAMLLLSSGYLSWLHIGTWSKLLETSYGLMLLVKVGLVLLMLALAMVNLLIMKPQLQRALQSPESPAMTKTPRRFGYWVGLETLVAVLVLLAAGVVAELPRAWEAPSWREQPNPIELTTSADDVTVTLRIEPAVVGQNKFIVKLQDANGQPVRLVDVDPVSIRFVFLDPGSNPEGSSAVAVAEEDGSYTLEGSYISVFGTWSIEVTVRRPEHYDAFAQYQLIAHSSGKLDTVAAVASAQLIEQWSQRLHWLGGALIGTVLILFALLWGVLAIRAAHRKWQIATWLLVALTAFGFGVKSIASYVAEDYTPLKFTVNPYLDAKDSMVQGQRLYRMHCLACHGLGGQGRGHLAEKLIRPARPFIVSLNASHSDGDIFYWIQNGIEGSAMPSFAEHLNPEETWHLVNYVRRLMGAR